MKKMRFGFLLLSAVASCSIGSFAETLVGELPGEFVVNNKGAASYTIPLTVSPGTAGIEPRLAVGYSSQSGNGLLGLGFSINGISSITRGSASLSQEALLMEWILMRMTASCWTDNA